MYSEPNPVGGAAILMTVLLIILILSLISCIPYIFFLRTLNKTLKIINPKNRKLDPGSVWLLLIPIFYLGWNFVVISGISKSLKLELKDKNIQLEEDNPGYYLGLAYSIICCCLILIMWIPFINILMCISYIIIFILYWVKINNYKNELEESTVN